MFRTTLCAVALSAVSFVSNAVETQDVLVVFDQNTISTVNDLDNSTKRLIYANKLIYDLNQTFLNSGLANKIQFRLEDQIMSGFSTYSNGKIENLKQIWSRYQPHFRNVLENKTSQGTLYNLQNQHNVDLVIAVMKEGTDSGLCGVAVNAPNQSFVNSNRNIVDVAESAAFGLFWISAHSDCLDERTLAAHEFGDTAGLYHGNLTDGMGYYVYRSDLIRPDATGYSNSIRGYQTIMSSYARPNHIRNNNFSDINANDCGPHTSTQSYTYTCGDVNASSVYTLGSFYRAYNKRGDWYQ